MKKFWLAILLVLSLELWQEAKAKGLATQEFYLDNGLQVIVIENHKAPIVEQMLFYKVGAVDEKPGQGGIAHLLEHLMFRGTAKVEGEQFNRALEKNGAESNAFTAQDVTAYYQLLDISRLELAMFLEADRMRNLEINDEAFATERDIVFEERKQRVDSNPTAIFAENVRAALWLGHPYGRPVTGQDKEIKNLTRDMAVDFYRTYYAPNNAILVLAGDIDLATAKRLVNKYYGNLKPSELIETQFDKLPGKYKNKIEMKLPGVKVGRMIKMFATPSLNFRPEMVYALEVLAEYLGGDESAPLYQTLVIDDDIAASVSTSYSGIARSYGEFVLSVVPKGEMTGDFDAKIENEWQKSLKRLNQKRLDMVKQKMLVDLVYLQDNPSVLAQIAGYVAAVGGEPDYWQNYAQNINSVTLEDITEAAKYLQEKAQSVVGMLYPEEKVSNE